MTPAGVRAVPPPHGDIRRRLRRVAGWGALATLVVVGVGLALERLWLGPSDQTALAHVAADTQDEFAGLTRSLATTAQQLARDRQLTGSGPADVARTRALFDMAARLLAASHPTLDAVSVYDTAGRPVAWAGRPSTPPPGRLTGRSAVFVAPGSLVVRVVHVEPVMATGDAARRVGTVVTEAILPRNGRLRDPGASPIFESALVPLTLREVFPGADETLSPYAFALATTSGTPLLTALVPPRGLADLRAAWRGRALGLALLALAVTLTLLALVLRDAQERERRAGRFTALLLAMVAFSSLRERWWPGRFRPSGTGPRRPPAWLRPGSARRRTGSPRHSWRWPWSRCCSTWSRTRGWRDAPAPPAPTKSRWRSGRRRLWRAHWSGSCWSRTPSCCAASSGRRTCTG